jgi:hypothetical protein
VGPTNDSTALQEKQADWRAGERLAFRQPFLAEDCDTYAYISRNLDPPNNDMFNLWLGQIDGDKAHSVTLHGQNLVSAVTVARQCGAALVKDASNQIHIVPIGRDGTVSEPRTIAITQRGDILNMVVPGFTQAQPSFAAAPLLGEHAKWRVGWPTTNGLAVLDIRPDENQSTSLVGGDQMLTGLEASTGFGSLSFSPDGRFALLVRSQAFNVPAQVRLFDFDISSRQTKLDELKSSEQIRVKAC